MAVLSDDENGWQELNAYVDGELPPARAAAVAEAIAADRVLARQVAQLSRMKSGLAAGVELPESLRGLPAQRRSLLPGRALAACLAGLLALGGAAAWLQWGGTQPPAPRAALEQPASAAWLDKAVAAHRRLAALDAAGGGATPASAFPGWLPDLAGARLRLAALSPVDLPGLGSGVGAQYRGTRGCRVSLLALEGSGALLSEGLARDAGRGFEIYSWRVGAVDYLLLAEGMDPQRLATIAETVHGATRRLRPLDADEGTRLADARRRSLPCRA